MGYTTEFEGQFDLDHPLAPEHKDYLKAFSEIRHMTWNVKLLEQMEDDPIRKAVGLPIGEEGLYFTGKAAIDRGGSTFDHPALDNATYALRAYNVPPSVAPNLWCQWKPNSEGTAIQYDEGEKFHGYTAWLQFLLEHFLIPWGYKLNGHVRWRGEYEGDEGIITVSNNEITREKTTHQDW